MNFVEIGRKYWICIIGLRGMDAPAYSWRFEPSELTDNQVVLSTISCASDFDVLYGLNSKCNK